MVSRLRSPVSGLRTEPLKGIPGLSAWLAPCIHFCLSVNNKAGCVCVEVAAPGDAADVMMHATWAVPHLLISILVVSVCVYLVESACESVSGEGARGIGMGGPWLDDVPFWVK